jgi:hypothetical protein
MRAVPLGKDQTMTQTYTGGCHCGDVRFEVTAALESVATCNCSICSKTGSVMAFAPAEHFKLLAGEDSLTDYQFAKMKVHHVFCKRCGIRSFNHGTGGDGKAMYVVNVRCLDGIDYDGLPVKKYDGKSL